MIIIDTSAWIEYFRNGTPSVTAAVTTALSQNFVALGDLIYCEVMQGIKSQKERTAVSDLFLSLPKYEMVGFLYAEKSAANYRMLRSHGISIGKTIDVLIATFCIENRFQLLHNDRDFDLMVKHLGLFDFPVSGK